MARATTKSAASTAPPRRKPKSATAARAASPRRKPRSLEDAIVNLATTGQLAEAGRAAVRAQHEAGLPVTYQRGNEVVKEFPDGRREVIATLEPPEYRLPKGVARIRNRAARGQ